ncbi:ATP-binding protein [Massilia putida]|uniref:ATP-binding protein n=1 Tax=Massilia putida TaxID=1141883 RepID=UPI0009521123|nr:ATP-binding protein [Massilia putida]
MTFNCASSPILPVDARVMLDVHNLKALRQRRGGREALSEQFHERRQCLTRAAIKRAESGKPVPYRTVRHLAAFYGIGVESLIDAEPQRQAQRAWPARPAPDPTDVERLQCRAVIDAVHVAGQGRIIDVQGVAGAGKSRLVTFCASDARARGYACVVLEGGAAAPVAHTAAHLMLALLGLDRAADDARLADRVRECCAALALPAVHIDACVSLIDAAPEWPLPATQLLQTAALCALIQHRVRHNGGRRPLLICIDDLQSADWQLAMLLNVAVPATLDYPVLWIFATRLEPGPTRRPLGVRMDALARTTLHLTPPATHAGRADAGGVHRLGRADV